MSTISTMRPWQLPDGIDELLPEAAAHVEKLRRDLLDCAARWGYRFVMPPLLEFTDSLLVGVGEDLDILTFKVADPVSGRLLGLRADMTPQVARIDAHSLNGESVNRLCYAGSTLHTQARSLASSRSPLQLGAELYGDASLNADFEVIELMLSMLEEAGIALDGGMTLDLGNGDIFRHLLRESGAADLGLDERILDALKRKSRPDLEPLLAQLSAPSARAIDALLGMQGGSEVLEQAAELFADAAPPVLAAIEDLRALARRIAARYPQINLYTDLAELRGYAYHTGVVFAVYLQGLGEALARGGRYDNVGRVYGRARPATGFATDLSLLAAQLVQRAPVEDAIAAPDVDDADLQATISALRDAGRTVIRVVGNGVDPRCTSELVNKDGNWVAQARRTATEGEGR